MLATFASGSEHFTMEPIRLMVVDIYHGDRVVSFARAKQAGIFGIIHKASEGAGMVDKSRLGRKAVLYSGALIKEQLGDRVDPFFGSHRLWLAEYGPEPRVPRSWSQQWLWQYSGDGIGPEPRTVAGIPGAGGALDCNSYQQSAADLAAQWAS